MNLPIQKYPADGAANENVLFSTLGSFWTRVFNDQAALKGLSLAQAEEIFQGYYGLIEAIDSYSASNISVFKKVKWLPLLIKKSELAGNVLKFGEGVTFGAQVAGSPYIFGAARPQEENVYVIPLPEELRELTILTNRVISPSFVLVNNMDVQIRGGYLYFYGDPFELPNLNKFDLVDSAGNRVFYTNPLTGQPIPDEVITLWGYNSKIDSQSLTYNIAYLFGANLPTSEAAKGILNATVNLFSGGPSVKELKALCAAFLGVKPILEAEETIEDIFSTATHNVVVTDKHVYRYDLYYPLKPEITVGLSLSDGDIPVEAVEIYDNVLFRNWWLTKMTPRISSLTGTESSPSFTVPPYMFVGNYKYGLTFSNSLELVTRAADGTINFPVTGNANDVAAFQAYINESQEAMAAALGGLTSGGEPRLVNPLDFLFRCALQNNSALVKVNFQTEAQLVLFTKYFPIIKGCLPKHVYLIFFFDISVPTESYSSSAIHEEDVTTSTPCQPDLQVVSLNSIASYGSNQNVVAQELLLFKPVEPGVTTQDYNFLDITKLELPS